MAEDQSLTTQVVESEQQQETVTNSQTVEQVPIQDGVDVVAEKIPAEVFFCVFFFTFLLFIFWYRSLRSRSLRPILYPPRCPFNEPTLP